MGNDKISKQLKDFMSVGKPTKISKERSKYLALVSMTVYKYMDYMMEELGRAGFDGVEFLAKCELFLKCVTNGYSKQSFDQLLKVLEDSDPEIVKGKFYYGIKALRSLCTGEGVENIEIMKDLDKFENIPSNQLGHEVVFFTTFLIENIQRYLRHFRDDAQIVALPLERCKHRIADEFDNCVVGTVLSIQESEFHEAMATN